MRGRAVVNRVLPERKEKVSFGSGFRERGTKMKAVPLVMPPKGYEVSGSKDRDKGLTRSASLNLDPKRSEQSLKKENSRRSDGDLGHESGSHWRDTVKMNTPSSEARRDR